jgi:putative DNA primase/helicase
MANQASFVNVTAGISQENPAPGATPEVSVVGEVGYDQLPYDVEGVEHGCIVNLNPSDDEREYEIDDDGNVYDLPPVSVLFSSLHAAMNSGDLLATFDALDALGCKPLALEADESGKIKKPMGNGWGKQPVDRRRRDLKALVMNGATARTHGVGVQAYGYVVCDIDTPDKDRSRFDETLAAAVAMFGDIFHGSFEYDTAGGRHIWFKISLELLQAWFGRAQGKIKVNLPNGGALEFFTGHDKRQFQVAVPPSRGKLPPVVDCVPLPVPQVIVEALLAQLQPPEPPKTINVRAKRYHTAVDITNEFNWASDVLHGGWFDSYVHDHEPWLTVGFALQSKFGADGIRLWDSWSHRSNKYSQGECTRRGNSFDAHAFGGITFGRFINMAKSVGAPLLPQNDPDHPERWKKRPTPAIMAPQSTAETEESYTPGQGECEWDEPAEDSPASEYLSDEEFVRLVNDCMPGGHTDAQFAKLVLTIHGDRVRYVPEWHKERPWLAYDARKGVWDRTEILQQRFVLQVANRILDKHGKTPLAQSSKLESCCKVMRLDPAVATRAREIDAEPFILNVANGVLNLKTLELQPHSPACLSLKQSPVKYDPIATAPKWVDNLAKYLPDKDVRDYVQRYLGSALLGKPVTEALLFHGVGANGKTTVTATVGRVLGDADAGGYAAKMPQGFCAESKNDKHPTELTLLHGARLALASETKAVDRLDESKIKSIQGDGTIQARGLYENFWSFEPTHNLILSVNPLPKIAGRDDGIWRRWRFVHWPYQVPDEERIQEYDKVLFDEEGAGILNWLLEGLADYLANGMRPPAVVLAETAAVRESGNWAGQLVEDYTGYELDGETPLDPRINRVKLGDVYARYAQQCKDGGEKALNANLAGKPIRDAFEAAGFECRQVKNLWWILSAREKTEADIQNELDRDIYEGV